MQQEIHVMNMLTVRKTLSNRLRHKFSYALTFDLLSNALPIFIGLFMASFCYGQQLKLNCINEKGKVVPFVHAFVQQNGQIIQGWTGNKRGDLIISRAAISNFDSLEITAMGYHPLSVEITSILQSDSVTLRLEKNTTYLNEVTVSADKSSTYRKNLGTFRGQKRLGSWSYDGRQDAMGPRGKGNSKFGSTLAAYVKNTENRVGFVEEVKIKLSLPSEPGEALFRLAIFSVDTILSKPGKAILDSAIFVKQKRKFQRWLKINLKSYPIPFPKEGLFIGLQYIATDTTKRNVKSKEEVKVLLKSKDKEAIQQFLHRPCTQLQMGGQRGTNRSHTWRKRSFLHDWEREKPDFPENENFFAPELIVKAKIAFFK